MSIGQILFLVLLAIVIYFVILRVQDRRFIISEFRRCNNIVFGKKGTGKDLLFQFVTSHRKEKHYSNIPYTEQTEVRSLKYFSCYPNTYKNFIEDKVKVISKENEEKVDLYISDGGIILPSQYQGDLVKLYPSFPTYYALSRHLTNSNIHINTQNLSRVWDKLREQADSYFMCLRTYHIGRFFWTSLIYYDRYATAKEEMRPFRAGLFSSAEKKALKEDFEAKYGRVRRLILCQLLPKTGVYDTRYYHKVLYGVEAPKKERRKKQKRSPKKGA